MKLYLYIILTLLFNSVFSAQIYKWTDDQGVVHFSDIPHDGAAIVNLPKSETLPPSQNSSSGPNGHSSNKEGENGEAYDEVRISQPENNATIRNNQGDVSIAVSIKPDLAPGHLLQLIVDGTTLGQPQSGPAFSLHNVNRGTHTIAVQILNAQGEVLAVSDAITIFMQRARIGMVHKN